MDKLGIDLVYNNCINCSCYNPEFIYEGKFKDVSEGQWDKYIEYIFISDKGTDYQNILGGRDSKTFLEKIEKTGITNFFYTAITLCRNSENKTPNKKDIKCCSDNLELILQSILKTNELFKVKPPKIILLGKTVVEAMFGKKDKIDSLRNQVHSMTKYPCDIFVTYHPGALYNNEELILPFEQDLEFIKNYSPTNIKKENDYILIETIEEFDGVIDYLMQGKKLVYDIETTGNKYQMMKEIIERKRLGKKVIFEEWREDIIIGISFSCERNTGIYLPLWVKGKDFDDERKKEWESYLQTNNLGTFDKDEFYFWLGPTATEYVVGRMKTLLENPEIEKCNQNVKFDNQFLIKQLDIHPNNIVADTMLMSYLLNENVPNSLEYNSDVRYPDLRGYKQSVYGLLTKDKKDVENYADIPLSTLSIYGPKDTDATLRLWEDLATEIEEEKKNYQGAKNCYLDNKFLLDNLYMPLQHVYTMAELRGVYFDREYAEKIANEYTKELREIEEEFFSTFQRTINLNSPVQLQELLFVELGWPIFKTKEKGQPQTSDYASTDQDHIKRLREEFEKHPDKFKGELDLIAALLDYKKKQKMISTYLRGKKMHSRMDPDGFVHTSYLLHGAVSGRLSSRPNLQNMPKKTKTANIRGVFTARPGWRFWSCDESQVEMRIMADYAQDPIMLYYIDNNIDIHWRGCKEVFYNGKELEYDPTDFQMKRNRKLTKLCNFGGMYLGSDQTKVEKVNEKLERDEPKITMQDAQRHSEWFWSEFERTKEYQLEMKEHILCNGWIDSKFGRRRILPDAFSDKKYFREEAVRAGINAQIQGTASDIAQWGFIKIYDYCRDNNLESWPLITVHDEADGESPEHELELIKEITPKLMTSKTFSIHPDGIERKIDISNIIKVKIDSEFEVFKERWGN
jgi:uracil-DNA glycosylase family 4